MLVKTKQNSKGEQIYVNKFTGVEGTLGQHTFRPSIRQSMRETIRAPRVVTNRKSTRGRRIYMQIVNKILFKNELTNEVVKATTKRVIKHIQETPDAIQRKTALFNFNERLLVLKSKWHKDHPEYQKKAV
jgi:hypothetical protein